jgi:hypothetical protein
MGSGGGLELLEHVVVEIADQHVGHGTAPLSGWYHTDTEAGERRIRRPLTTVADSSTQTNRHNALPEIRPDARFRYGW